MCRRPRVLPNVCVALVIVLLMAGGVALATSSRASAAGTGVSVPRAAGPGEPAPNAPRVRTSAQTLGAASVSAGAGWTREIPVTGNLVALQWSGPAGAAFSVAAKYGSTWKEVAQVDDVLAQDGPDRNSSEAKRVAPDHASEALWVGNASTVRVTVRAGTPTHVVLHSIDSPPGPRVAAASALGARAAGGGSIAASAAPGAIISRAQWGADESLRRCPPRYAEQVQLAVVHHTAGNNNYTADQVPQILRGVYAYETQTLGFCDIAYNFLIDKYGRIFEGRAGGISRTVVGAHASGVNTGSTGVAIIGDFSGVTPPPAATNALVDLLTWKLWVHGVNPAGRVDFRVGSGNLIYPPGIVNLPTIVGHRDVGSTACPGGALYSLLPAIRGAVAARWNALEAGNTWRFETLDGAGGGSGRVAANVGSSAAATTLDGLPHVFYRDDTSGVLRHAWYDGARWYYEVLDGAGGPDGRVTANVGGDPTVVFSLGQLHVFYRDATGGSLRHAFWDGSRWRFETIDNGPNTGGTPDAIEYGGVPHVWYHDVASGRLRHAWWTGSFWAIETLDGAGGPDGRIAANVGRDVRAVMYGGVPHVFYADSTHHIMRHGWWTGAAWRFETLAGPDANQPSAVVYQNQLHVFFGGASRLQHLWWTGYQWLGEVLDGWGVGPAGQIGATLGNDSVAMSYAGTPHVWYVEYGTWKLRHAWWTGSFWAFETLDGAGGGNGRVQGLVGAGGTGLSFGQRPHIFYYALSSGDLRHGWWG